MSFYEIKIEYHNNNQEYKSLILQKVKPLIEGLEAANLIQGFHFMQHSTLDLRLAIDDTQNLDLVNDKIAAAGFADSGLSAWNGFGVGSDEYRKYGPDGISILVKSLEFNSRLIIMLLQLESETTTNLLREIDHQIVHYFLLQQGIDNLGQIEFGINDAKMWANAAMTKHGINLSAGDKKALARILSFKIFG